MAFTPEQIAAQQVRAGLHASRVAQAERLGSIAAGALERGGIELAEMPPERLPSAVLALVASDAERVVSSSSLLRAWSSRTGAGSLSLLGDPAPGYAGGKVTFDGVDDFVKGPEGSSWEASLLSTTMFGCVAFETGLSLPAPVAGWPTAGGYAPLFEAEEANVALYIDSTGLRLGLADTLGAQYRTTGIALAPATSYCCEYELAGRVATLRVGVGPIPEEFATASVTLAADFDTSIGAGVWLGLGNGVPWAWSLSLWAHCRGAVPSAGELAAFRRWLLAQGLGCAAWGG